MTSPTATVIQDDQRNVVVDFVIGVSNGSDATNITVLDISTLTPVPHHLVFLECEGQSGGPNMKCLWKFEEDSDHASDVPFLVTGGESSTGRTNFRRTGGKSGRAAVAAGGAGDVICTTNGQTTNERFYFRMWFKKKYA